MTSPFRAFRIHQDGGKIAARFDTISPDDLDEYQCMALGTAGYTAALAIHRMERNGQRPENGEIVVTGATGGVGSLAIDMLAGRGYRAVAVTGKQSAEAYLKQIGAARI